MEVEVDEYKATHWSELSQVRDLRIAALYGDDYMVDIRTEELYLQWRKLVDLYGRLIITTDTDRLPTLSGLAKLAIIWNREIPCRHT